VVVLVMSADHPGLPPSPRIGDLLTDLYRPIYRADVAFTPATFGIHELPPAALPENFRYNRFITVDIIEYDDHHNHQVGGPSYACSPGGSPVVLMCGPSCWGLVIRMRRTTTTTMTTTMTTMRTTLATSRRVLLPASLLAACIELTSLLGGVFTAPGYLQVPHDPEPAAAPGDGRGPLHLRARGDQAMDPDGPRAG
jgi:hypothetical protein